MGQSVTTPLGVNSLDSFTFWLNAHHSTRLYNPAVTFRAYVMAWNAEAEHTVGPVLYESGPFAGPSSSMQRYDFLTGGVSVNPGSTYLVFLSLLGGPTMTSSTQYGVLMGYGYDEYAAGRWYATNNGPDANALNQSGWTHDTALNCQACDAAFRVEYSNVAIVTPEPSTLSMAFAGLLSVVVLARRRRKSRFTKVVCLE